MILCLSLDTGRGVYEMKDVVQCSTYESQSVDNGEMIATYQYDKMFPVKKVAHLFDN